MTNLESDGTRVLHDLAGALGVVLQSLSEGHDRTTLSAV